MKKILSVIIGLTLALIVSAQDVKVDSAGNYYQIKPDTTTGKIFTDYNGAKYPVYKSKSGKLYVMRTSKEGNKYRYYLKLENN